MSEWLKVIHMYDGKYLYRDMLDYAFLVALHVKLRKMDTYFFVVSLNTVP